MNTAKSLEDLLQENYHELKDKDCQNKVLEFIASHESVEDEDVLFIKQLTKVASHISKSNPKLVESSLARLYRYNQEGVRKIHKGNYETIGPYKAIKLEAHFLCYMADMARELHKKTKNLNWMKKSYSCNKVASEITLLNDPEYVMYSLGFAGDAARVLYLETLAPSWGEKWYDYDRFSAQGAGSVIPKHAIHKYRTAAHAAEIMYGKTKDISWKEKEYECVRAIAQIGINCDLPTKIRHFISAAHLAMEIHKQSGEAYWRTEAVDCYQSYLQYRQDHNLNDNSDRSVQETVENLLAMEPAAPRVARTS